MFILELTSFQAILLAFALPILLVSLFVLLYPSLKNGTGSRIRRYLSYTIVGPNIGPLNPQKEDSPDGYREYLRRQLKLRLYLVYLAIGLFVLGSFVAEFYHVMSDLSLHVSQGSTGIARTWSSVAFLNLFDAGWVGSLPWYGAIPLPPANAPVFHDPWSWVFFTDTITDNPVFFESRVQGMLLMSAIVGLVFLLPLGFRTVRESFVPSLFYLTTSMLMTSRAILGLFAQGLSLGLGGSIQYGIMVVTGVNFPGLDLLQLVAVVMPIILALYAIFLFVGRRIWQIHYPSDHQSRRWFALYVSISYWLSLLLTIVMA
ncbi:MAG: hypothetical protein AM324_009740 [Candidatus Thorarchaeota archaeon SMTZ1-83]|nr:MAG: hypothetical protein AM324_11170 [Candidatus Thorarchaeota archaeon SMTZ1-83]